MIDAVTLENQHPPAILMEVGRRGSKRRGRSDRSQTDQHDQQPPRRPPRTRYFTGALAIGVIVLIDGPEGPYECQIIDRDPDGTWVCNQSF